MTTADTPANVPNPVFGHFRQRVRLYTGLVLFAFAATHLINHALGLISIEAMELMRNVRVAVWRSPPGTVALYGALILHVIFSFLKFIQRRSWRMTAGELIQLAFGLAIPIMLLRHAIGTRMAHELFGVDDNYTYALWVMWPAEAYRQAALILLVWVHGCIGLHFWLKFKPWYGRIVWPLYGVAVALPLLSYAGFAVAGRNVRIERSFTNPFEAGEVAYLYQAMDVAFWACIGVVGAALAYRVARSVRDRFRPTVSIAYADGRTVVSEIGPTLLEISRSNGIPHASVCGGRARCSTCRVRVLEGHEALSEPDAVELKVLERVGAGAHVRLACQLVPSADMCVAPLLPARRVTLGDAASRDKYLWGVEQTVAIMFADIRGFTAMSETKLPYDVVFVLNQYLGQMSDAITDAGGYVDKFIGDGIMAIFGMERGPEEGARNALAAARDMGGVLAALNNSLAADLDQPLRIGIGIHSGQAILGRIGVSSAAGATQRITALGDTVNTASRLESASKDLICQLVVSQSTVRYSGYEIGGGRAEQIAVKGREEPVSILAFDEATDMVIAAAPAGDTTPSPVQAGEPGSGTEDRDTDMDENWQYQVRINLADEYAEIARGNPDDPRIKPLADILARHDAVLKCQYDAFAGYVEEAEREGVEKYALYAWTRDTIENPEKKAKYIKSFTLYVGGDEVYDKDKADALEAELEPLAGGDMITRLSKHDTNPANNPQPPKKYRS